jgi:hypothetical protein
MRVIRDDMYYTRGGRAEWLEALRSSADWRIEPQYRAGFHNAANYLEYLGGGDAY